MMPGTPPSLSEAPHNCTLAPRPRNRAVAGNCRRNVAIPPDRTARCMPARAVAVPT